MEHIKPLIDQYFKLDASGKQIWKKLNIATEKKKDYPNMNEVNSLAQDTGKIEHQNPTPIPVDPSP
jgi:hypothetical protein